VNLLQKLYIMINFARILSLPLIEALEAIPEHQRQVMSVLAKSRQGEFITSAIADISTL
jgi:hypothetical protein